MSEPSSDLHELPDLAGDVRERVVIPPYSEVSRRVRARRLRVATGTLASAVLLVGGVAVWQGVSTTAGPSVPQPAGATQGPIPPTDESLWRAVVDGTDSHPFEVEGTDDGSIAVVWRALEPGAPTYALVIREADGSVHGMRLEEPVSLTPVPGGWVGMDGSRGHLIGSDGTWSDLAETSARPAQAGDVVVTGQYSSWLYSSADPGLAPMPALEGGLADGFVTSSGDLVACVAGSGGGVVGWTRGSTVSHALRGATTCVVAGRGDSAVVVGLGDDPDGAVPMKGMLLRRPGQWLAVDTSGRDLSGVTSVVVTPAGSAMVTNASDGRSLVVRSDGDVVEPARKVGQAFVAGDRLYVSTYGLMNGPLYVSDDDGRTWQETTLPGNESKQG